MAKLKEIYKINEKKFKYYSADTKIMVLELLFNPFMVKKKPWQMFVAGFIYSFVGLALAYFVFKEIAGILTVFLIVIATLPLLYTTITNEEELDLKYKSEKTLLKEHSKVLTFLMFLFFGITTALVLAYIVLPQDVVDNVFKLQDQAITNVNNSVINGQLTGHATKLSLFIKIFINNVKVLFFCLVFSFLYGTGAMFILTWNASVIATAIGKLIKTEIAQAASYIGFSSFSSYVGITAFSFFRYMTHGVFEIMSYFIVGLAGGIISIALIKHNFKENAIFVDVLDLVLISLGLLLMAGFVEVYITPILFA